jgi:hypothetical protein
VRSLSTCALALGAALASCSAEPASRGRGAGADGWSDRPAPSASAPPRPEERWDLAEQLRPLRPSAPRGRSEHLGGTAEGEVLASPASGYPPRGPTGAAAAGATVVERLLDPAGAATAYFVMVKHPPGFDPAGGDWEYLVVAPDGRVEDRGKLALCARCHAEAPHDHLFGGGR